MVLGVPRNMTVDEKFKMRNISLKKLQQVFNILQSIWKKTFKTVHQLSCFVGHPVKENKPM